MCNINQNHIISDACGVLSLYYEFSMGIGTCNFNHESPCYIPCIECTHMPFQFLAEVVAEFYDFSAFSPFLAFDCGSFDSSPFLACF